MVHLAAHQDKVDQGHWLILIDRSLWLHHGTGIRIQLYPAWREAYSVTRTVSKPLVVVR